MSAYSFFVSNLSPRILFKADKAFRSTGLVKHSNLNSSVSVIQRFPRK